MICRPMDHVVLYPQIVAGQNEIELFFFLAFFSSLHNTFLSLVFSLFFFWLIYRAEAGQLGGGLVYATAAAAARCMYVNVWRLVS